MSKDGITENIKPVSCLPFLNVFKKLCEMFFVCQKPQKYLLGSRFVLEVIVLRLQIIYMHYVCII